MPAVKPVALAANPANFPLDAGRIPDIGFSTPKSTGKAASVSLSFAGSNITTEAKLRTYDYLQHACATDTSSAGLASALNCAPSQPLRLVQQCNTLYNTTAVGAQNGTALGAATANGVSAHLTVFTNDWATATALPCYSDNMQAALQNATNDFPAKSSNGKTSSAAPSQKASLALAMGLAASAAIGVLHTF